MLEDGFCELEVSEIPPYYQLQTVKTKMVEECEILKGALVISLP